MSNDYEDRIKFLDFGDNEENLSTFNDTRTESS